MKCSGGLLKNRSVKPAVAELTVDKAALAIPGEPTWRELLGRGAIAAGDRIRFELEAHRTKVFAASASD